MAKTEHNRFIYRILIDLIKSDETITVAELDGLDEAVAHFGISQEDKLAASGVTLAQAVDHLAGNAGKLREDLRKAMLAIAMRDSECCRAESLMLTMMDYLCEGAPLRVISMPLHNRPLLSTQLLYLEDKRTCPGRDMLENQFDELSNLARLGGLELIYIPKVSEQLRSQVRTGDLRRMLAIVSPESDGRDLNNTVDALRGMNTRYFYNSVIRGALEMEVPVDSPIWIMRIPDSNVGGSGYANFLCMDVQDDVRVQIMGFVARLNSRQGSYSVKVNDARGRSGSFLYSGFYKAMMDLMSVKKIDKWDLHIRMYGDGVEPFRYTDADGSTKKCVMTLRKDGEEHPLPLTGRDVAFYLLLLCASANEAEGGVDFHDDTLSQLMQERYAQLFRAVSRRVEEPLVWDPVFRIPMRSRVSAAINESVVARESSLQSLYQPTDRRRGLLYIPLEPARVIIDTMRGSCKLEDSALYRDYLAVSL